MQTELEERGWWCPSILVADGDQVPDISGFFGDADASGAIVDAIGQGGIKAVDGNISAATVAGDVLIGGPMTWTWWQHVSSTSSRVIGGGDSNVSNRFSAHCPWSDGVIYWDCGAPFTAGRVTGAFPSIAFGQWAFVAMRHEGAGGAFRGIRVNDIDVLSDTSPVPSGSWPAGSPIQFSLGGSSGGYVGLHAGLVDDVRLFPRVVSDEELDSLYDGLRGWSGSNLSATTRHAGIAIGLEF